METKGKENEAELALLRRRLRLKQETVALLREEIGVMRGRAEREGAEECALKQELVELRARLREYQHQAAEQHRDVRGHLEAMERVGRRSGDVLWASRRSSEYLVQADGLFAEAMQAKSVPFSPLMHDVYSIPCSLYRRLDLLAGAACGQLVVRWAARRVGEVAVAGAAASPLALLEDALVVLADMVRRARAEGQGGAVSMPTCAAVSCSWGDWEFEERAESSPAPRRPVALASSAPAGSSHGPSQRWVLLAHDIVRNVASFIGVPDRSVGWPVGWPCLMALVGLVRWLGAGSPATVPQLYCALYGRRPWTIFPADTTMQVAAGLSRILL
jgi:hypothetical protein